MNRRTGCWIFALTTMLLFFGCGQSQNDHTTHDEHEGHEHEEHEEHHDEVKLSPEGMKGIRTGRAERRVLVPTFSAPARVTLNADAMAHISSVVRGRVVEIKAKKNDIVEKGQELLVVDSPELGEAQSDYLQKRTGVAIAASALELHAGTFERMKNLHEQTRSISLTELEERENMRKSSEGTLRAAEAALVAAGSKLYLFGMSEQDIAKLTDSGKVQPRYGVMSPISGTVLERETTLGEYVTPEREELMILADLRTLWVIADVPEARVNEITIGSAATVKFSGGRDGLKGTVSLIDVAIDPETRSARVRIDVPGGNGVRPGMFVLAELELGSAERKEVVAVPVTAVQTVEGETSVFVPVEGEANTFSKRKVRIGKPVSGWHPAIEGLKEGEEYVVDGSFLLKAELGKGSAKHVH